MTAKIVIIAVLVVVVLGRLLPPLKASKQRALRPHAENIVYSVEFARSNGVALTNGAIAIQPKTNVYH